MVETIIESYTLLTSNLVYVCICKRKTYLSYMQIGLAKVAKQKLFVSSLSSFDYSICTDNYG